jgi:hypothetical protein
MDNELEKMIYTAAIFRNTNVADIARTMGMAHQNLRRKMKHCTLKPSELAKIGKILGGEYIYYFSFSNGTNIGKVEKKKAGKIKTA